MADGDDFGNFSNLLFLCTYLQTMDNRMERLGIVGSNTTEILFKKPWLKIRCCKHLQNDRITQPQYQLPKTWETNDLFLKICILAKKFGETIKKFVSNYSYLGRKNNHNFVFFSRKTHYCFHKFGESGRKIDHSDT
jgi:hypothetical protein